jgi:DNA-binding PadR family transcriptional regulator
MKEADVLAVIRANPGLSGFQIMQALVANSRAARWFGKDSVWAVVFGPSTGGLYPILMRLERTGQVTSIWGVATPERGGHRPRLYFAKGE